MNNDDIEYARGLWKLRGQKRPANAIVPGPGQESVWDYPRPPLIVDDNRLIQIKLKDVLIAETRAAKRVLETASPPTFYLPPDTLTENCLRLEEGDSFCEWKGRATYFSVCVDNYCAKKAAWCYSDPILGSVGIKNYISFYPGLLACYVDHERVHAQPGGFYGGWVTREIVGPFKGEQGTSSW